MNTAIQNVKETRDVTLLTKEDEVAVFTKLMEAKTSGSVSLYERYRDKILVANQRLVGSIAKSYTGRGMALEDLKQEGNMGLLKAIEKFDITLGNRFSTYATYWIKQSIELALYYQNDAIRVPVYFKKLLNTVYKAQSSLTVTLGRIPTAEEIADKLDMDVDKVTECLAYTNDTCSLDRNITSDDDGTMVELVSSKEMDPAEKFQAKSNVSMLLSCVGELPEKEQYVILSRYGLNGGKTLTLEQIGKALNVSHERVRQIERKALSLLRNRMESELVCLMD